MKPKIWPIILGSIFLGTLFDFLFYGKIPGISVLLYVTLTFLTSLYLVTYYRQKLPKVAFILMGVALLFALFVMIRTNGFLAFLNIVMIIYLLLISARLTVLPSRSLHQYTLKDYIGHTFALPLKFTQQFGNIGQRLLGSRRSSESTKRSAAPIIRGIILSLPFLLIFLLLFASADLVFKNYLDTLFDFNLSPELITHTLLIIFIASLFLGAYALLFLDSTPQSQGESLSNKLRLGSTEASIVLGSVGTLFLIFVLIQIAYLFGGQNHVLSTNLTYAEYARRGFFELIAVAVISLLLILGLHSSTVRDNIKQKTTFMWLSGVLILEVMVIMLSAYKRLGLYEQAYGFTSLRLYSHLFIIWLAIVFVLLLIHIFWQQKESQFALGIFISIVAFLALLNIINPDALIARQNIQRFYSSGKIDIYYLKGLSEDATPEISQLLTHPNEKLQKTVAWMLYDKKLSVDHGSHHWQSYNLGRERSKQVLQQHASKLEANKDYNPPSSSTDRLP